MNLQVWISVSFFVFTLRLPFQISALVRHVFIKRQQFWHPNIFLTLTFFFNHILQQIGMVELSISTTDMIRKNFEKNCLCCSRTPEMRRCQDNRYLLIMTEKYSSLPIIKGMELDDQENMSIIFGSSFPKDQEFTQVISFSRECTHTHLFVFRT